MSRRFKSETEVAAKVVAWLEETGWETYKEVDLGAGVADIVAVQGRTIWIVETKTSLSTSLARQGLDRLPFAHFVSIAAPRVRSDRGTDYVIDHFCRSWGIGRFEVGEHSVSEVVPARVNRLHARTYRSRRGRSQEETLLLPELPHELRQRASQIGRVRAFLEERHKTQVAGQAGGGHITPYKKTIEAVRQVLRWEGRPLTVKEIVDQIKHHYSSPSAARATLRQRLLEVETDFQVVEIGGRQHFWLKGVPVPAVSVKPA